MVLFVMAGLAIALVGCGQREIIFVPPPPEEAWPREWQSELTLERLYPKASRPFGRDKLLAGDAFLVEYARVTPELLLKLRDYVLVGSSGAGRFSVNRYQLEAVESGAGAGERELYRLTVRMAGPDTTGTVVLGLDHRLRLWSYDSQLFPLRGGVQMAVIRTSAKYLESTKEGAGYQVAGERGEVFVPSKEPRIPEELLPVLPLLCPHQSTEGNFETVSAPFRGVYLSELVIRPAANGKPESLVALASRSPMGKDIQAVVDHSAGPRITWASDAGGLRWFTGTTGDVGGADHVVSVIRRERGGHLMFNGTTVFSAWRPDGTRLGPADLASEQPSRGSWLSVDVSPLDLTFDSEGRKSNQLLNLKDRTNAETSVSGRGMLREGERRLDIEFDFLPAGDTLEMAAERLVTAFLVAGQKLEVAETRTTVDGKPAIRVDMRETVSTRGRAGVSVATVFHSFFMVADGQTLLRLQFTMGPGWGQWVDALEATCASVRFSSPRVRE
jgi:hypothetical protein